MGKTRPKNYINISEAQRDNLASELATLLFKLKKDESVQCVYITSYIDSGEKNNNALEVTIVRHFFDEWDKDNWVSKNNIFYQCAKALTKFGVKINIFVDDTRYYTTMALNPSECKRENYLMNANILLDKKGEYTKIKELAEESVTQENSILSYYNNLAEIQPPLIDKINSELEKKQEQTNSHKVNKTYRKSKKVKTT